MNLLLTDFMETVPVNAPQHAKRFLVFANDEGEELRVPVGPEAIEAITRFVYRNKAEDVPEERLVREVAEEVNEEEPEATTFGGDLEEEDPDDEDPMARFELPPPTNVPESEDKVPSV